MPKKVNRRRFVKAGAGIASSALIAGCSGDGNDNGGGNGNGTGNGDTSTEVEYPTENLTYIVPFAPGGGTDTWARQLMPVIGEELGVNIRIENIEGSDSLRGTAELYNAEPDGSTFGGFNPPSTPSTWLIYQDTVDFDITDFRGIGMYSATGGVLLANPDAAEEYGMDDPSGVANAYQNGDLEAFGAGLRGSYDQIRAILLQQRGIDWDTYVGYDGSGALVQAIASGEVPVGQASDTSALSAVEAGSVEVVGSLYSEGTPVFPEAEPITEHGMESMDYVGRSSRAMWVPPETPDYVVDTLSTALEATLNTDELQQWSEETGNPIIYEPPEVANETLQTMISEIQENVDLEPIREAAGV